MILPTTIVDNFLEDPDSIREYALKQEYTADPEGNWPGTRSPLLSEINPSLANHVTRRIMALFWDVKNTEVFWESYGGFQLVKQEFQQGWVHQDNGDLIIAIIYLTPNADPATGTSLYRRNNIVEPIDPQWGRDKCWGNTTNNWTSERYKTSRELNNSRYTETLRVANVYNRLFVTDSSQYHGVPAYETGLAEERLTMTFFFRKLGSIELGPMQRYRRIVD
jgi:hypothetical protein